MLKFNEEVGLKMETSPSELNEVEGITTEKPPSLSLTRKHGR